MRYDFKTKQWSGIAHIYDLETADIEHRPLPEYEVDHYVAAYTYHSKSGKEIK